MAFLFIAVNKDLLIDMSDKGPLTVHSDMCSDVGIIMLFPGITAETVSSNTIVFHYNIIICTL